MVIYVAGLWRSVVVGYGAVWWWARAVSDSGIWWCVLLCFTGVC